MKKLLTAALIALTCICPAMPAVAQQAIGFQATVNNKVVVKPVMPDDIAKALPTSVWGWDSSSGQACILGSSADCGIPGAGGGGGAGGAISIPDGSFAAFGTSGTSPCGTAGGDCSAIALWKYNNARLDAMDAKLDSILTASTSLASVGVKGGVAAGVAVSEPPVPDGCRASSAAPTAVSDGQVVNKRCDLLGNTVTFPFAPRQSLVSGLTTAMTGTTSTAVTGMGAPGAGLFNYITTIVCGNSHATVGTFVDLQDGNGGTVFWTVPAGVNYGGAAPPLSAPIKQPTANTALYAVNKTNGANVICSVAGFKAP